MKSASMLGSVSAGQCLESASMESDIMRMTSLFAPPCLQDTYGPPLGKKLLMFVDDVNMPRVDTYGTQQPIALLKLFVERKGFYDRGKELSWKNVKDVQMVGAMGPPGGARNTVDPRFISLFSVFEIQAPSNSNLRTIYQVGCSGPGLPWMHACWQDWRSLNKVLQPGRANATLNSTSSQSSTHSALIPYTYRDTTT
jgi:hypothetical protein